jgi:hypothetical protein
LDVCASVRYCEKPCPGRFHRRRNIRPRAAVSPRRHRSHCTHRGYPWVVQRLERSCDAGISSEWCAVLGCLVRRVVVGETYANCRIMSSCTVAHALRSLPRIAQSMLLLELLVRHKIARSVSLDKLRLVKPSAPEARTARQRSPYITVQSLQRRPTGTQAQAGAQQGFRCCCVSRSQLVFAQWNSVWHNETSDEYCSHTPGTTDRDRLNLNNTVVTLALASGLEISKLLCGCCF